MHNAWIKDKNQYICQKKLKNEKIFKKIKKILINVLTFLKKYSNINKRSEIVLETWWRAISSGGRALDF